MYSIEEKNYIWLSECDFLSYQKSCKILSLFDGDQNLMQCLQEKKYQLSTFLTKDEYIRLDNNRNIEEFENILNKYEKENIVLITLASKDYPSMLKDSVAPPLCLYCKGNTQLLDTICCGVVGTRKPTDYGKITTQQFTKELAEAGATIVSGLATGVDTIAHETALKVEGATIAVIAGGFDHIYPAQNYHLYKEIIKNNLIISEHKPSTYPSSFLFPLRNRIIAGLSKAVLITEAGIKSGAMHTKNYAIEAGREIFAIPGKISSPESEGTNLIIKQCQSCLCQSPNEIIDFLHLSNKKNVKKPLIQLDITEQSILNYILVEKKTYQEIIDYTNIPPNQLNIILMNMQMKGVIEKLMGNSYIAIR